MRKKLKQSSKHFYADPTFSYWLIVKLLFRLQHKYVIYLLYRRVWFFGEKEGSEWKVIFFPLFKKTVRQTYTGEVSIFSHVLFCWFSKKRAVSQKGWVLLGSNKWQFGKAKRYLMSSMCFWKREFKLNSPSFPAPWEGLCMRHSVESRVIVFSREILHISN